jgi:hypothetical protein
MRGHRLSGRYCASDRQRQVGCGNQGNILAQHPDSGSSPYSRPSGSVAVQVEGGVRYGGGSILGGGEREIRALTVTTYDSAYIHADKLGNRFGLIISIRFTIFQLPGIGT